MTTLHAPPHPIEPGSSLVPRALCGRTVHVFETAQTRWLLDLPRRRFLRTAIDTPLDFQVLLAEWSHYHELALTADGGLTIVVDADAGRMLHARPV